VPVLRERAQLSSYTTLRVGGPAARLAEASTADDLVRLVSEADQTGDPILVLGGGSNLVIADDGFPGTVALVSTSGVSVSTAGDRVLVQVAAGESWDPLVEWAVTERLAGIECLAGIPGLVGATPIQNVGAYGQELASSVESVVVFDRASRSRATLTEAQCAFGYRTSVFKVTPGPSPDGQDSRVAPTGRYVVLGVTLALRKDSMSEPVRYAELATRLGIGVGDRAPLADVRRAVLELRRGKGMVLDPADPDTTSAGSFFTNPVLDARQFAEVERVISVRKPGAAVPRFPADGGLVKVPAAWLIEQAGFGKGYPGYGPARISAKHTLALTNRGGASAADLIALARELAAGVRSVFGIDLVNEPVLVGVTL
jgi:UDP-N-acetylmuramate dehydrogenase